MSARVMTAGEEPFEEQVDAAALALHQLHVVEDAREAIVPAPARVKDVPRCDADRQAPWVYDLEAIGVQVQVDVTALRVGPLHERIHEQLANDELVVRRKLRTEHAVGHLVALAKVRDLVPDFIDQLDGRQLAVVPAPLRDLHLALVVAAKIASFCARLRASDRVKPTVKEKSDDELLRAGPGWSKRWRSRP
jgi:hypothetical protein